MPVSDRVPAGDARDVIRTSEGHVALAQVGRELFALRKHDAWDIHWRLVLLDMARRAVLANKKDLLWLLADTGAAGTFSLPLDDRGRHQLYELTVDVARRLLNFTASTKQALDHSRKTATNLCRSESRTPEIARCLSKLKSDPETCFMADLRNLLQHQTVPPLYAAIYSEGRPARIRLRRDFFRTEDSLSGPAKRFVRDHRSDFGLLGPSRRFAAVVVELVEAVIGQIASENADVLRSLYSESDRIIQEDAQRGSGRQNLFIHRFA